MSELTRRRDTARNEETWLIFLEDVHIGTIGRRAHRCRAMGLALRLPFRIAIWRPRRGHGGGLRSGKISV